MSFSCIVHQHEACYAKTEVAVLRKAASIMGSKTLEYIKGHLLKLSVDTSPSSCPPIYHYSQDDFCQGHIKAKACR